MGVGGWGDKERAKKKRRYNEIDHSLTIRSSYSDLKRIFEAKESQMRLAVQVEQNPPRSDLRLIS